MSHPPRSGPGLRACRESRLVLLAALAFVLTVTTPGGVGAQENQFRRPGDADRLAATTHPPLPSQPSQYWLVPDPSPVGAPAGGTGEAAAALFARGARLIAAGDFAAGLPLVSAAQPDSSPFVAYAMYYKGLALSGLLRYEEADTAFRAAAAARPEGSLREAIPLRLAGVALEREDPERAKRLLQDLNGQPLSAPEDAALQLAAAEEALGHPEHAIELYHRVYYEFPLSEQAVDAQAGIERLQTPSLIPPNRFALELVRAERLFAARRWAQARAGFAPLAPVARGDDRELIALRLAQCDHHLGRHQAARDALAAHVKGSRREAEARFFHLTSTRALNQHTTYVALARRLVADHPDTDWAVETLNNLASHYVIVNDDAQADGVFRELYRRFPRHPHAERAAWRIGWLSYKQRTFAETADLFEQAAAAFPRSDYRPAWLYWSGRARDQQGDQAAANARYRLTVADYQNIYHGRLASQILASRRLPPGAQNVTVAPPATPPNGHVATDSLVRALVALQLYDDALREVQYAQRVWSDSPRLQATVAWIRHHQGRELKATERFTALRGSINAMRRAYPQFMAAGGEALPPDVLRIIFPLDYWPLIEKYSSAHKLDPYLMAALMAQESTFTPEIRSSANAIGLMQIIPATGRRYATKLGIRNFSTEMLTQPETNVRIGMLYFRELMDRFGSAHLALASYNAGEGRIARWVADRPGMPQDEFIEDIPFPETQNYVKRILGTAEDYRRLYATGLLDPHVSLTASAAQPGRR